MLAYRSILAVLFSTLALAACGGSGGTATGDKANGQQLVMSNVCSDCHTGKAGTLAGGDVAMGGVYGPNLTPDKATGLGGWTDAQIAAALTMGTDEGGKKLCASMPMFPFTEQEQADVIAYLRSLTAVSNKVPSGTCAE